MLNLRWFLELFYNFSLTYIIILVQFQMSEAGSGECQCPGSGDINHTGIEANVTNT